MLRGFLTADSGATAGSNSNPTTAPAGAQAAEEQRAEEKRFTQAELDALIKDRLERQRRAYEQQQKEAQQALEAQKLEDQKEFEKLAKQRAEEINSLKPRATLAEGYEKRVAQLMLEATKDLPANIQTILAKLPLPDQLDWLSENLDTVKKPATASPGTDINAWSRNNGGSRQQMSEEEFREKKRRENQYR